MRRNISYALKNILKIKRMSQRELAAVSGIPESTIRSYSQGIRQPNEEQIARLAAILNVDAIDLYRDEFSLYNPVTAASIPVKISKEEATPAAVLDMIPDDALADFFIDHVTIAGKRITRTKLRRVMNILLND